MPAFDNRHKIASSMPYMPMPPMPLVRINHPFYQACDVRSPQLQSMIDLALHHFVVFVGTIRRYSFFWRHPGIAPLFLLVECVRQLAVSVNTKILSCSLDVSV